MTGIDTVKRIENKTQTAIMSSDNAPNLTIGEDSTEPQPIHLHTSRSRALSNSKRPSPLKQLQLGRTRLEVDGPEDDLQKVSPRLALEHKQLNKLHDSLSELQKTTHFGEMELKDLFSKYTSKVSQNQGKMDKKLFVDCCSELLNLKSTEDPLVEQYYKLFDRDENELIDFREFVTGASILLKGTPQEKIKFVFSCYDLNGNGTIEKSEMRHWLSSMFRTGVQMAQDVLNSLGVQEKIDSSSSAQIVKPDTIERIVNACFSQASAVDGTISEEQFVNWVSKNEQIMKLLSPGLRIE